MNTNVALYARVSTDEQAYNFSLDSQIAACREYIGQQGYRILDEFPEDYTGTKLSRPKLDKIRELAQNGTISRIVVYEIDRLARKMAHQIIIEEEFRKLGVIIDYVLDQYEDTPEGNLRKNLRSTIAEYEREKILERFDRGRKQRAKTGYMLPGGVPPYGYSYTPCDGEKFKGEITIVEEEAAVVRLIYQWYAHGDETGRRLGLRRIALKLTEMRIPTRFDTLASYSGNKKKQVGVWCFSTVKVMLKNPMYRGECFYNKTHREGTKHTNKDRSEWIAIPTPSIVSVELWEMVQQQMKSNTIQSPRNTKQQYLLQNGRMRCAKCGKTFYCHTDSRRHLKKYYECGGQLKLLTPDNATLICTRILRAEHIDEAVWDLIKATLRNPAAILQSMSDKDAETSAERNVIQNRLDIVDQQIATLQSQRARLLDLFLDSALPKQMLDEKTVQINDSIARFETEAQTLRGQLEAVQINKDAYDNVMTFCATIREGIDNFTFEDKRVVLETLQITCLYKRGETPDEDRIVVSGLLPQATISIEKNCEQDIFLSSSRGAAKRSGSNFSGSGNTFGLR